MARTFFFLLILLNTLALAWIFLKGDDRTHAGREPLRAKSELAPGKIRLLAPEDSSAQGLAPALPAATAMVAEEACRAYAGATETEAQELVKAWSQQLAGARVTATHIEPAPVFDIVIPGLVSRAAAEAKLTEVKKFGTGDSMQVRPEDDKHFSVLIATFPERSAAEDALKNAAGKGLRSAAIVQRQVIPEQQTTIEVRGNDASLRTLAELVSSRKGLTSVDCAAR